MGHETRTSPSRRSGGDSRGPVTSIFSQMQAPSVTSTSSVPRARFAADKASTKKGRPRFSAQVAVPGAAVHEAPYFADRDDFFEQPGCRSPSNSVEFH